MDTVNNNFEVMQSWRKPAGEMWDRGELRQCYEEYEWRDYFRDNIDGDGRSRYQLWKNERYTWESFDPKTMQAEKEKMIKAAAAAEKRAAEKKGNAWTRDERLNTMDVCLLLDELVKMGEMGEN